ncbi:hypothetical protein sscle_04g034490 [Sclerotinia sclerotiorum 1980 UF-70]|uniref:Uncharacterized protein n=1 Tax=Sclerotinia sclerotiorum (strain ATCC 18683 / 1980 / Ss-1) TaxID=665079 RepID=A0A1D9Q1D5_SCLS1|nr:hypothetical protein sscle_04g034490 [Sclerotinia sclerotiorum 1980 UF-70]
MSYTHKLLIRVLTSKKKTIWRNINARETLLKVGLEVCQMTEELVEWEITRMWSDGDETPSSWKRGDIYFPMAYIWDAKCFDLDLDPQMAVLWKEQRQKMAYDGCTNRYTDVSDVPTTNLLMTIGSVKKKS